MRKILAAAAILLMGTVAAFAIEPDDVFVDVVSEGVSRSDFEEAFADVDVVSEGLDELAADLGASIVALEPLDEDDYDSDFDSVYDIMMSSVEGKVKSKSVYAAIALANQLKGIHYLQLPSLKDGQHGNQLQHYMLRY